MKNLFSIIMMALGMGSCSAQEGFESVSAIRFAEIIDSTDVQLVDVRTAKEYAEGHIADAVNMDVLETEFKSQIEKLDKQKKVAVYCRSGRRSKTAANILVKEGFEVVELSTGYIGWTKTFPYPAQTFLTANGNRLWIALINHGSLALKYGEKWIQVDPVSDFYGKKIDYSCFPKADIILITHEHGDHLHKATIDALSKTDTRLLLNVASQKQVGVGETVANGDQKTFDGIDIKAVPAYNITPGHEKFHPKGNGNGYLLNFDRLKVYISGDTENIQEMSDLKSENIDVAFLSVNQPYTMTPEQCIDAATRLHPRVLIPYHMGDTDMLKIQQGLEGSDIDVRLFEVLR